jgi:uncharacterized protein YtpQ (UPF0354 family)
MFRRTIIAMGITSWLAFAFGKTKGQARSPADIGSFRDLVVSRIQQRYKDAASIILDTTDPAKFTARMGDTEVIIDVTNVFGHLQAYEDEDVELAIQKLIAILEPGDFAERENIVALVRSQEYLSLGSSKMVAKPLVADISIVYAFDAPDSVHPMNTSAMLGMTIEDIHNTAMSNLEPWLSKVTIQSDLDPIHLYYVEGNPILSSSLILLEQFWTKVELTKADDLLILIPRRDQLFILDAKRTDALLAAKRLIEITYHDGFNLLSPNIYRRKNGKLEAF